MGPDAPGGGGGGGPPPLPGDAKPEFVPRKLGALAAAAPPAGGAPAVFVPRKLGAAPAADADAEAEAEAEAPQAEEKKAALVPGAAPAGGLRIPGFEDVATDELEKVDENEVFYGECGAPGTLTKDDIAVLLKALARLRGAFEEGASAQHRRLAQGLGAWAAGLPREAAAQVVRLLSACVFCRGHDPAHCGSALAVVLEMAAAAPRGAAGELKEHFAYLVEHCLRGQPIDVLNEAKRTLEEFLGGPVAGWLGETTVVTLLNGIHATLGLPPREAPAAPPGAPEPAGGKGGPGGPIDGALGGMGGDPPPIPDEPFGMKGRGKGGPAADGGKGSKGAPPNIEDPIGVKGGKGGAPRPPSPAPPPSLLDDPRLGMKGGWKGGGPNDARFGMVGKGAPPPPPLLDDHLGIKGGGPNDAAPLGKGYGKGGPNDAPPGFKGGKAAPPPILDERFWTKGGAKGGGPNAAVPAPPPGKGYGKGGAPPAYAGGDRGMAGLLRQAPPAGPPGKGMKGAHPGPPLLTPDAVLQTPLDEMLVRYPVFRKMFNEAPEAMQQDYRAQWGPASPSLRRVVETGLGNGTFDSPPALNVLMTMTVDELVAAYPAFAASFLGQPPATQERFREEFPRREAGLVQTLRAMLRDGVFAASRPSLQGLTTIAPTMPLPPIPGNKRLPPPLPRKLAAVLSSHGKPIPLLGAPPALPDLAELPNPPQPPLPLPPAPLPLMSGKGGAPPPLPLMSGKGGAPPPAPTFDDPSPGMKGGKGSGPNDVSFGGKGAPSFDDPNPGMKGGKGDGPNDASFGGNGAPSLDDP
eukprot:TRINITY_DN1337_c0_g1_i5.p1 TRINITY_DN1337_c0_g1~~TRINITY_DN1337_c0_g1_i5.p1  ORF type:complete len:802 (+),score=247.53 TRINITY_DN1337_c0_g1_i5:75-2480(+)